MSEDERVSRFVDAVKDDPRVLGVGRMPGRGVCVLLVCTWDGGVSLVDELPLLGAHLTSGLTTVEPVKHLGGALGLVAAWSGVGIDGQLVQVELSRVGDLVPDGRGAAVRIEHDPRGWLRHWHDVSTSKAADTDARAGDAARRAFDSLPRDADESALFVRFQNHLRGEHLSDLGARLVAGADAAGTYERFLATADDEGFKGDRVLFGEATKRLRDLSKREPLFDQGFVVPTFDAVEAAFALGEAVGGCQPPLIPGVYVGVGVTPTDALEFWAAPFVRDPTCSVACVDDAGERDVVERAAGREPMVATLTSAVDAAWERLPALIDRARDGSKEQVDPSAVLAALHLPRSFVERAKRRGAGALMCSRLTVALAVARAGHDCAPLVARKFGLAAGRVLAAR